MLAASADFILPPPPLPTAAQLGPRVAEADYPALFADMFLKLASFRAEIRTQNDLFERFYREVERSDATAIEIGARVDELFAAEQQRWAQTEPFLGQVSESAAAYRRRQRADRNARSMVRVAEEILDAVPTWLELFQNLRLRLIKLASARDQNPGSPVFSTAAEAAGYLRQLTAG